MSDERGSDADRQPTRPEPVGSRRGSALVSAGILVSRLTGLVRERGISHFLGTSVAADAFTVAFRLPNMLQHLLGEGVLSASFIPVYSRLLGEGRDEEAGRVAGAVLGLLAVAAGAVVAIGVVFAEPLTSIVAAGLRSRPDAFALTVRLVRILFPAVGLLVLGAWCLGVLNSHRRFFLSYVAPALLNLTQVAVLVAVGLFVVAPDPVTGLLGTAAEAQLVTWLAVGTVLGGLLQVGVQVPSVLRITRGLRPSLRTDLPGVRTTLRSFVPVVSARGVVQVSVFVHVLLASFLAAGALATLRYSQILYGLPIALFGMAVAAAELPEVSRSDRSTAGRRLAPGLARIATFVVPTAAAYLLLGDVLVAALFQTGQFARVDTVAVWLVLGGYALGLPASTSSRLLQSVLYGAGDPRTPARVAVVRVAVSAALGALLMFSFDRIAVTADGIRVLGQVPSLLPLPVDLRGGQASVVRLGALGLSLGSAVAAWIEYTLLRRTVARTIGPVLLGGGHLRGILLATTGAMAVPVVARPVLSSLLATDHHPIVVAVVVVTVVVAVYVWLARRLGVSEIDEILGSLRRRLTRGGAAR